MDGKSHEKSLIPDKEKTREFWSRMWEKDVKHNKKEDLIKKAAEELQENKQQNIEITPTKIKERIRKMAN